MGLTIRTCKKNVDLTASGMFRFRNEVAKAYSKELADHYSELGQPPYAIDYKAHDAKTEELWNKYDETGRAVINFIYQSDCDGKLSPKECKLIYNLLKDIKMEKRNFSYVMRPTDWPDILEIFEDAATNRHILSWY